MNAPRSAKDSKAILCFLHDDERIKIIREDQFVRYPFIERVVQEMEWIHTQPRKTRMECLFVRGENGMGKTKAAVSFVGRAGLFMDETLMRVTPQIEECPIVFVDASGIISVNNFYQRIVDALAGPEIGFRQRKPDRFAPYLLAKFQTRTLIIDEVQELSVLGPKTQQNMHSTLKYISNSLRIGIIGLAVRNLDVALRADTHLMSRFRTVEIPRWKMGIEFVGFVSSYVDQFPLRLPSEDVKAPEFIKTLLEASDGVTRTVTDLLRSAAVYAILGGREQIDTEMLRLAILSPCPTAKGGKS